ncbi:MAG: N-acetyltransferase [Lewinellaceae bacterium]|nr:N-acetyltransferase [Phaeodactylibacter sp.]MCB0614418.1 N-acetyltransferase [Phaeodactylibacter sp.]MCB9347467.1 N-acetyltransferase [Lewinellaceae bacterium]
MGAAVIVTVVTAHRVFVIHLNVIFVTTEEGNGIASLLAKTALEWAKEEGKKVMPLCPYIAEYIKGHPEWKSMLLEGFRVD